MKIKRLTVGVLFAVMLPGLAFALDKVQGTMTQPLDGLFTGTPTTPVPVATPVSPAFVNGASKTKVKVDGKCKIQVQIKKMVGLADSDQDELTADGAWCLGFANAVLGNPIAPGSNISGAASIALNGDIKKGGFKINTSIQEIAEAVLGTECSGATLADINVLCFEPDAAYDPAAACGALPGLAIPHPGGLPQVICITSPTLGLPYAYLPLPSSSLLAQLGGLVP